MVISRQVRQEMENSSNDLRSSYSAYFEKIDDNNARMYVVYSKDDDSEDYPNIESTMKNYLGLYSNNHIQVHFVSGPEEVPPSISQRKPVPLSSVYPRFERAKLRSVMERLYISRLDNGKIGVFIPVEQTSFDGMGRESREEAEKRSLQRAYRQEDTNRMVRSELKGLLSLDSARKENFVEHTYESQDEIPSSYIPLDEYLKNLEKNVGNENLEEEAEMEQPLVIGQPVMEEGPEIEAEPESEAEPEPEPDPKAESEAEEEMEEEMTSEPFEEPDHEEEPPADEYEEEYGEYEDYDESEIYEEALENEAEHSEEPRENDAEEPAPGQEPHEEEGPDGSDREEKPEQEAENARGEAGDNMNGPEEQPEHGETPEEPSMEGQNAGGQAVDGIDGVFYDKMTRTLTFDRDIDRPLVFQVMQQLKAEGNSVDVLSIAGGCSVVHSDAFVRDSNGAAAQGLGGISSLIIKDRQRPLDQTGPWMDGLPRIGAVRIECGHKEIGSFTLEKGSFRFCELANENFTSIPARFMAGNMQEDLCVTSAAQITEVGNDAFNRIYDRTVILTNSKGEKKTYSMEELGSKNRDFHVWKIPEYNNINKMIKNTGKETEENVDLRVARETAALLQARNIVLGRGSNEGGIRPENMEKALPAYYALFDAAKLFSEYPVLNELSERLALMDIPLALDIERQVMRKVDRMLKTDANRNKFMDRFEGVFKTVRDAGQSLVSAGIDARTSAVLAAGFFDPETYNNKESSDNNENKERKEARLNVLLFGGLRSDENGVKGMQVSWDMSECRIGDRSMMGQKTAFNRAEGIGGIKNGGKDVRLALVRNCEYLNAVFRREVSELMAKRAELEVAPGMGRKERAGQIGELDSHIGKANARLEALGGLKAHLEKDGSTLSDFTFTGNREDKEYIVDLVRNVIPNREGMGDLAFAFGRGPSVVEDAEQNKLYQRGKIDEQRKELDKEIESLDGQIAADKVSLSRIPPLKQSRKDMENLDSRIARLTSEVLLAEELAAARSEKDPARRAELLEGLRGRVEDVKASHSRDKNRPETVLERIIHENKSFAEMVEADKAYLGLYAEIVGKLNGGVEFTALQGELGKLEALRTASEVCHGMDTSGLADVSGICRTPKTKEELLAGWPELSSHIGRISRYSDEIAGMAKYNNAYAKNAYARTVTSNHRTAAEPDPKPRTAVDLLLDGDLVKLQEWRDRIETDKARKEALEANVQEAERLENAIRDAETKIGNLRETRIALDQKWEKADGHVMFGEGTHAFNYDPEKKQLHIDRTDGLPEGACYRYMRKQTKDGKDNPFLSDYIATGTLCENGRFKDTCAYTELPRKKRGIPVRMIILNGVHATSNLGRMAYGMLGGAVVSIFMPTRQVFRQNIVNIFKLPLVVANGLTGGIASRFKQSMINRCLETNLKAQEANKEAMSAGRRIPYPVMPYQLKQTRGRDGNTVYGMTPELYMKISMQTLSERRAVKKENRKNTEFRSADSAKIRTDRERRDRNQGRGVLGASVANNAAPSRNRENQEARSMAG